MCLTFVHQPRHPQDVFCLTFTATYEQFGEEVEVPLVPGGADKPVTSKNREEYVEK